MILKRYFLVAALFAGLLSPATSAGQISAGGPGNAHAVLHYSDVHGVPVVDVGIGDNT